LAADPAVGRADARAGACSPTLVAVEGLYERHGARVLAYCRRRLGSEQEAEDALQTTFLYACRGLERGVVPETEIAWLLKIAHNVCLTTWDSNRRRRRLELAQDPDVLQAVAPASEPSGRESVVALEAALGDLTDLQRRAILLREWRGLSYQEVAERLQISQSAVETLIFRARRTVARSLERQDVDRPRTLARCLDFGGLLSALKSAFGLGGSGKLAAGLVGAALLAGSIPDTPQRPASLAPRAAPPAQVSASVGGTDLAALPDTREAAANSTADRRRVAQGTRHERGKDKQERKNGSRPGEAGQLPAAGQTLDETVEGVTGAVNETVRRVRETVDETLPEILPPILGEGGGGGGGGLLP
jgi:RNA polymerase sigma-70 factor, ECF subfamily